MSEWIDSTVGKVTEYQRAGGTPTATINSFYGGDIPFVTIEDITNGTRFLDRTEKCLSESGLANSNAWFIKEPHILYSMYATVGKPIINRIACATNQAIIALKTSSEIEPSFLFYQLLFMRPEVYKYTSQTTQSNLNAGSVKKLPISYPRNKNEQKKITTILAAIDTAIETTETLITKYQHIKTGLMLDLLTRGILHNGQLRPPRYEAPELYQETTIGWVPREWITIPLAQLLAKIDAGWSPECPEIPPSNGEWGVLKVSAVTKGIYDPLESKTLPYSLVPDPSIEVADGDVILTRANGVPELVGVTVQVKNTPPKLMLSDKLLRLVPKQEKMSKEFLALLMTSNLIKSQIDSVMSGSSGQRNISQAQLKGFVCIRPDLSEQERILTYLRSVQDKLEFENLSKEKLLIKKLGLMQDLLTGKVPVKVDEPGLETST
ncbi:restriction endonuclease subunit S [Undibacterium sp. CY18W]|uniref:Restriction endonuclease subunit S n=1 Tax=Undibacterium hunanense TaxID=2762292 RepID=A0ABR6ZQG4_9BURK|nr:restriction endonuclease subunit S [Undibacterium hunanense]MBC3918126.1 restriction endonuclease subunit S [Undibacterium hunanense]